MKARGGEGLWKCKEKRGKEHKTIQDFFLRSYHKQHAFYISPKFVQRETNPFLSSLASLQPINVYSINTLIYVVWMYIPVLAPKYKMAEIKMFVIISLLKILNLEKERDLLGF